MMINMHSVLVIETLNLEFISHFVFRISSLTDRLRRKEYYHQFVNAWTLFLRRIIHWNRSI